MSHSAEWPVAAAGAAFDGVAEMYDDVFTATVIGRAQRDIVWEAMAEVFHSGDRVLELNCGTGEDAFFLARRAVEVEAYDASAQMIEVARRKRHAASGARVAFRCLLTEHLGTLDARMPFDGVLSNFAGLNCVRDLDRVAANLAALTRKGADLLLCFASRVCAWEFAWYCAHGQFRKAGRRFRGSAAGHVGDNSIRVWYPTMREIERAFAPWFELRSVRAVGLFVPPSYLEFWASRHPRFIRSLARLDRRVGTWPLFRGVGDHVLLRFEKAGP